MVVLSKGEYKCPVGCGNCLYVGACIQPLPRLTEGDVLALCGGVQRRRQRWWQQQMLAADSLPIGSPSRWRLATPQDVLRTAQRLRQLSFTRWISHRRRRHQEAPLARCWYRGIWLPPRGWCGLPPPPLRPPLRPATSRQPESAALTNSQLKAPCITVPRQGPVLGTEARQQHSLTYSSKAW